MFVCKVAERYPKDESISEQQQDVEQFLEWSNTSQSASSFFDTLSSTSVLRNIDEFLTKLSKRNLFERFAYHEDDKEDLQSHKESLSEAKTDYVVKLDVIVQSDTLTSS